MSEAVAMLELAERLSQAERTIEALLAGQIDAVVDSASNTPVLLAKAQHALRKSEELYRRERDRAGRFLDAAEVILLAKDEYGSITLINRYGAELLGWSTEDLIGKSWPETCIPVRLREAVRKEYAGILLGGGGISEHEVLLRSGGERLIKWRNRVLTDEGGNVTGAFMCGTDITDEKRASDSLRAAEETMRFALEAGGLGIWDMNFKTGEMRWSKILEAQYGIPPGKFEGTLEAFIEAVHPDDRAQVIASLTEANRSGVDFKMAHRALRPDGSVRWLEGAGRVQLDTDGRPSRGVGVSQDVTEQTILATQFQQSQKMEAVGRLASGVAHDFNNLLTVILGFADLMTSDISPASEHGNDLAEIIKAAQRASGLTKQLLAFSRQQVLNAAHVDVNRLISEMTGMLERLIGEDIKIVVKLHSEVPHAL
nr:PAS domain-containing protein [Gemmatimonadaceae bacterium]